MAQDFEIIQVSKRVRAGERDPRVGLRMYGGSAGRRCRVIRLRGPFAFGRRGYM
jgi:hypothetical protein